MPVSMHLVKFSGLSWPVKPMWPMMPSLRALFERVQRAALLGQHLHLVQAEPADLEELQVVHPEDLHLQVDLLAVAVRGGLRRRSRLAGDDQPAAAALEARARSGAGTCR